MGAIRAKLMQANAGYAKGVNKSILCDLTENGQHPYAVVVCCSDSRVVPEQVFGASLGDLFVIRVAGNVLDDHQIGSIEYAVEHLHCRYVLVLGHTSCGAVGAALSGGAGGFTKTITDEILKAVGDERDPYRASCLNAEYAVKRLKEVFAGDADLAIEAAMYDIKTGCVKWLGAEA